MNSSVRNEWKFGGLRRSLRRCGMFFGTNAWKENSSKIWEVFSLLPWTNRNQPTDRGFFPKKHFTEPRQVQIPRSNLHDPNLSGINKFEPEHHPIHPSLPPSSFTFLEFCSVFFVFNPSIVIFPFVSCSSSSYLALGSSRGLPVSAGIEINTMCLALLLYERWKQRIKCRSVDSEIKLFYIILNIFSLRITLQYEVWIVPRLSVGRIDYIYNNSTVSGWRDSQIFRKYRLWVPWRLFNFRPSIWLVNRLSRLYLISSGHFWQPDKCLCMA